MYTPHAEQYCEEIACKFTHLRTLRLLGMLGNTHQLALRSRENLFAASKHVCRINIVSQLIPRAAGLKMYFIFILCAYSYMYVMCANAHGGQMRASAALELGLQAVLNCSMCVLERT